ncbi:outer membrane beta-barrel protein [Geomesophilobacter sediminis]|uniref:Outer membrane beta-barrel protein n=1 Tax=Geomesophilobacter sediminis TaxID=2798584 RepID=A0A8J7M2P3_9BACT|nr:outer membrane beta-barrel protein [Geomesophilobacter sediminis]MBJ6727643.1 outer membrane beta-barrel protein [Geomesophilobacter sediminis]
MRIKTAALITAAFLLMVASCAWAKEGDQTIEGTFNYGTEAFNDLGNQYGVTAGYGFEFRDRWQARADLSYYRTSTATMGATLTGIRVPLDLGLRYLIPLPKVNKELTAFGQGGVEISVDDWRPAVGAARTSDTRFGAVIGGGAEYALDPQFGAVVNVQYHVIEDGYLSAGIGMAYHF